MGVQMKMILVPVEQHETAGACAAPRRARAQAGSEAWSRASHCSCRRSRWSAWDAASAAIISRSEWDGSGEEAARALFERVMTGRGLAGPDRPQASGPRWRWTRPDQGGDGFLGTHGRAFDLTVVGQPRPGGSSITTLEAALFDSGGPILIAPPREVEAFGNAVVIAWNGSTETARTIAFAKPLLRQAERIVILADDGSIGHRPSGELVRQRLEASGIPAEVSLLPDGGIRSGERILARSRRARLRPPDQGRLHAEPPSPDDLRRRDEPYPGPLDPARLHGALMNAIPSGDGREIRQPLAGAQGSASRFRCEPERITILPHLRHNLCGKSQPPVEEWVARSDAIPQGAVVRFGWISIAVIRAGTGVERPGIADE